MAIPEYRGKAESVPKKGIAPPRCSSGSVQRAHLCARLHPPITLWLPGTTQKRSKIQFTAQQLRKIGSRNTISENTYIATVHVNILEMNTSNSIGSDCGT
jgi:hypothetical protein